MKTITKLATAVFVITCAVANAESKRTADYHRINPESHQDKEVSMDVSMVKPVHWKSPLEDISFFHALTIDRTEDKAAGWILLAVPKDQAEKFAKKYGTSFENRNDKDRLIGTFILVSGRGPSGLWMIDTTGKVPQLIKDGKFDLPNGAGDPDAGGRGGPGKRFNRR